MFRTRGQEVIHAGERAAGGWLEWDPFQEWEDSHARFEAELSDPVIREPLESAFPSSVEAEDAMDARMGPEGFTTWF
jgi:hypothetical protein